MLCGFHKESTNDIFVRCRVASRVWYCVSMWLGWELVLLENLMGVFHIFSSLAEKARFRIGVILV